MNSINVWAVLAAAVTTFLIGGPWYSHAMFGARWQRESGDSRPPGQGHPAKVFGLSFAFAVIAAVTYAWLIPPAQSVAHGALQGLLVGLGVVAASFGVNYQFANRSLTQWLIDGGYHTAQFVAYGIILGMWR